MSCVCVCVCVFWGEKKNVFWDSNSHYLLGDDQHTDTNRQTYTHKHIEPSSHIWWLSSNQIKSTTKKQLTRNFSWLFLIFAVCWCNNFWEKKQLNHLIMIQLEHCDFFPEKKNMKKKDSNAKKSLFFVLLTCFNMCLSVSVEIENHNSHDFILLLLLLFWKKRNKFF